MCPPARDATGSDGTRLRITAHCAPQDGDAMVHAWTVESAAPGSLRFTRTLGPIAAGGDEGIRDVDFIDLQNDGIHGVVVTGMCGAGPNCEQTLYRREAGSGWLRHFFSDGWATVQILDGHLVTGGRASCCSWEFHAWPLLPGPPRGVSDTRAFRVSVGMLTEDDAGDASCRFSRDTGGGRGETIPPPNAQWLSICTVYGGDYHLASPARTAPIDRDPAQD
ncbi:MAG: hypothetical protein ACTIJY_07150 [Luteimonas sp.]